MNNHERQLLTLAGMAGGVGEVLKAPIGGVLVMVEVFFSNYCKHKTIILYAINFSLVTSLGSYLTTGFLIGFSPILHIKTDVQH